jgi:hypothetical protein
MVGLSLGLSLRGLACSSPKASILEGPRAGVNNRLAGFV